MAFTVIYDACVLHSNTLRMLLVQLALADIFRARWSADIQREWVTSATRIHPDKAEYYKTTAELMNEHVREGMVTGYERLMDAIELPDPKDRHVVAAAIRCGAEVIVTYNLKDFPATTISVYGIQAQHPDEFLSGQLEHRPTEFCRAVETVRVGYKNPPYSRDDYLQRLLKQQLPLTVQTLQESPYWIAC